MGEPTELAEILYEQLVSDIETGRVIVVDVRNPDELESQGKIPGSINIPLPQVPDVWNNLTAEEFQARYGFSKTDPGKPLVFTCRAGTRARAAIDNLVALGVTNDIDILLYKGSFNDWLQKGGSLEK